jgi:hypothetical protein
MDDVLHLIRLANLESALRALFAEMDNPTEAFEIRATFDGAMSIEYVRNGQTVAGEGI